MRLMQKQEQVVRAKKIDSGHIAQLNFRYF